jgi:hypothetical protein
MLKDTSTLLRRALKLRPKQQLLSSILFMKHNNVIVYNTFMLNWAKLTFGDDILFIASCINDALTN